MSKITVKEIATIEGLREISMGWREIATTCSLHIALYPEWLISWLQCYKSNSQSVMCYCVYRESKLLGLIPLMLTDTIEGRVLQFLSDSCSDYQGFVYYSEERLKIKEVLVNAFQEIDFDKFEFNNIYEDNPDLQLIIEALSIANLKSEVQLYNKAPYIKVDSFVKDLVADRLKEGELSKKMEKLRINNSYEFRILNNVNDEFIHLMGLMNIQKWSNQKGFSQFNDERRIDFIKKTASLFSNLGLLRIFLLKHNNSIIAYKYGFLCNNIFYEWNSCYDYRYKKYSPGKLLLLHTLEHLTESGIAYYDFMNGEESYKYEWAREDKSCFSIRGSVSEDPAKREPVFVNRKQKTLKNKKVLILDIDGVVYKGANPVHETITTIRFLQENGVKVGFITNTSSVSISNIHEKLSVFGLDINEDYLMTSSMATIHFLKNAKIGTVFLIGGNPDFPNLLQENNIIISDNIQDVDAVLVAYSETFSYEELCLAGSMIRAGAKLVCTDEDNVYSSSEGIKPGTGWIVASISAVTNVSPIVIGKPSAYGLNHLLSIMNTKPEDVILVGDSLKSDIASGKKAGVTTCLLLGGVSNLDDIKATLSRDRPDLVVNSIREIIPNLISKN